MLKIKIENISNLNANNFIDLDENKKFLSKVLIKKTKSSLFYLK